MAQHRQARTVNTTHIKQALRTANTLRHPDRNAAMLLLSFKAGLRAGEIAKIEWSMLLDANNKLGTSINLPGLLQKMLILGACRYTPIFEKPCKSSQRVGAI